MTLLVVVACAAAVWTGGCASRRGAGRDASESSAPRPDAPAAAPSKPAAAVPKGSPLAKIQLGMGMNEVRDLIGPPTDTHAMVTGKAFIPYYYGDDTARVVWLYKGVGRVVFSAGGGWGRNANVAAVEADPNETGYYREK
jgi:hypothetical protein